MGSKIFRFTLRSRTGKEYRIGVPAGTEPEAERMLKSALDSLHCSEQILSDRASPPAVSRGLGGRKYHQFSWADKSAIYKTKQHKDW